MAPPIFPEVCSQGAHIKCAEFLNNIMCIVRSIYIWRQHVWTCECISRSTSSQACKRSSARFKGAPHRPNTHPLLPPVPEPSQPCTIPELFLDRDALGTAFGRVLHSTDSASGVRFASSQRDHRVPLTRCGNESSRPLSSIRPDDVLVRNAEKEGIVG